ncbi:transcriptional regulator NrdR [Candidatus Pacearchaeota archaeon CG10_big_fil_rev_8_21_14_0_10_35_13]|nr:MAG: transcriptional regulator NrdR [Candidatus Pacearchaeota archaeon CG10_big_fil_rev_8_21_14_0_10_35_13]
MICPFCKNPESKVTNKRDGREFIRRRRECVKCSSRFTTYERFDPKRITVIKKDGRRQVFSREKVLSGILRACEKRPIPSVKIDKVIEELDIRLSKRRNREISSDYIGDFIMKSLKKLDKVAYVRFASVYKDFKDLGDFKEELSRVNV